MASVIIGPIAPNIRIPRKLGKRPRIPSPSMTPRQIHHPPRIGVGCGIMRRIRPKLMHGAKILQVQKVIPPPVRRARQSRFRRLSIQKPVRLIRALIQRRTAIFGEANRLHPRAPRSWRRNPHTIDAVMMRVAPPSGQILGPIDPILAISPIHNRAAQLGGGGGGGVVIPIKPLPPRDIGFQILQIVNRSPSRIQMIDPVAPI